MRRDYKQPLQHIVRVKIRSKDEFDQLSQWIKENVSTIDRLTPTYKEDDWWTGDEPKTMTFRFRHEENAMAFKLILNSYQQ